MLFQDRSYSVGALPLWQKLQITLQTLHNPLALILDKLGLTPHVVYRTRKDVRILARARTADVNEAIVVLSGREYPPALLGISDADAPVVLDCGGHIGTFSLYVKTINPTARLYVLEPLRDNVEMLTRNLDMNGVCGATVLCKALSGETGTGFLDLSGRDFDSGTLSHADSRSSRSVAVEAVTLGDVLATHGITAVDLLKLDIEGSEYEVIERSLHVLSRHVKRIVMEYHPSAHPDGRNAIVGTLVSRGGFEHIYESRNILGFQNLHRGDHG